MELSWPEIRSNSIAFVKEFQDETREDPEAQTFWNDFFKVFGVNRRRYASFEEFVKLLAGKKGRIDLFWKGTLLVEHKSRGEDLDAAYTQALTYFEGIKTEDLPKYVLVSDFERFRLYDLDEDTRTDFALSEFPDRVHLFAFIIGQTKRRYVDAPPINIRAAGLMAELHDALQENGYAGHQLEVFLVRLMFCLFADYTGIFKRNDFRFYIEQRTKENGTDCGIHIRELFAILDTPDPRQTNLDADLAAFPHVNGKLFQERFDSPAFNTSTRNLLLRCCAFDWSTVSPAIFGSLFQLVMDVNRRRNIGAHYTSERDILKSIETLFLDELRQEVDRASSERQLEELLKKIERIKIFDPACGCGNFLIIAYRELRHLEIEIHKKINRILNRTSDQFLSVDFTRGIDVDSLYGIEIEEFPTRVAETALYLVDHQINMKASLEFGRYYTRLPLRKAPHIVHGNALDMKWEELAETSDLTYIIGNPPYVGKKVRTPSQNCDMSRVFGTWRNFGELDYVACWYVKAVRYIKGSRIKVAFVSTNSITQGEQVGILWPTLFSEGFSIHFAHRTFRWNNDAPGLAQVFCVIIGFALYEPRERALFDYQTPDSEPLEVTPSNINAYLVDADNVFILARRKPICSTAPKISFGNMPNDDGNLLLTDEEKNALIFTEPKAKPFIKRFLSDREFLNDIKRWCIWLRNVSPSSYTFIPAIRQRVENVRAYRLRSTRPATRALADKSMLFGEIRQPTAAYILIPRHTSENRRYIPMSICSQNYIIADSCAAVDSSDLYVFGVLMSMMHMAWVKQVCGRIKSDFRYSNEIVYNNYPWPENVTDAQKKKVRDAATEVLEARKLHPNESLVGLYDLVSMPPGLTAAHRKLDRAVDFCYRKQAFDRDFTRLKLLFELFEKYKTGGQLSLLPKTAAPKKKAPRPKKRGNKKL